MFPQISPTFATYFPTLFTTVFCVKVGNMEKIVGKNPPPVYDAVTLVASEGSEWLYSTGARE